MAHRLGCQEGGFSLEYLVQRFTLNEHVLIQGVTDVALVARR